MKSKLHIFSTILAIAVISWHIWAYTQNYFGVDQLIPSVVGYFSVWAIIMSYEVEEKEKTKPELEQKLDKILSEKIKNDKIKQEPVELIEQE